MLEDFIGSAGSQRNIADIEAKPLYYDVDYESGSGLTRFKWDVAQSGPVVGFSWEFGR
jgi:hypothetical protein